MIIRWRKEAACSGSPAVEHAAAGGGPVVLSLSGDGPVAGLSRVN